MFQIDIFIMGLSVHDYFFLMKSNKLLSGMIGIVLIAGFVSPSFAQPMIIALGHNGPSGPSSLYTVDAATGAATLVGSTGFNRCSGMDVDSFGTVFATCVRLDGTPVLVSINTATGAGTEVGPTTLSGQVSDISFRPSDDKLYAFDATASDHRLKLINTVTGIGSDVGSTGLGVDGGNGMTFVGNTLHHIARNTGHHTLDQLTGAASVGTPVTYVPTIPNGQVKAMDLDTSSGTVYAIINSQTAPSTPTSLATVHFATFTVTAVGPNNVDDALDAIAVLPEREVGGSLLPIDNTALLLTGLQASALWMIPTLVGLAGAGFYLIKFRTNKD